MRRVFIVEDISFILLCTTISKLHGLPQFWNTAVYMGGGRSNFTLQTEL